MSDKSEVQLKIENTFLAALKRDNSDQAQVSEEEVGMGIDALTVLSPNVRCTIGELSDAMMAALEEFRASK